MIEDEQDISAIGKRSKSFEISDYDDFLYQSKIRFEQTYGKPSKSKFTLENFDIIKTVGVGSFSKVVLAKAKETNSYHALKIMSKEMIVTLNASNYVMRERHILRSLFFPFVVIVQTTFQDNSNLYICMPFLNGGDLFNLLRKQERFNEKTAKFFIAQIILAIEERHILRSLFFPFVVIVQTTFQDNSNLYICMPFLNGGDLFILLRKQERFNEKTATFFIAQIILAIEYLHYLGLVYRDLKPENLLLDAMGYLRLTDFGFSKRLVGRTHTFCGTPEYMAPEIILGKGYGKGVDWWALGVLTFEMVAGRLPFQASDPVRLYEKIGRGGNVNIPPDFSPVLRSFVLGLLETEPTRRIGCMKSGTEEVKHHPWLSGLDWPSILDKTASPPFAPKVRGPADTSNYDTFEDIVIQVAKEDKYSRHFQEF